MFVHPYFDLIFHFNGIVGHCNNVDPEMYSYMDMLQDVNKTVLSKMASNIGASITVVYEFPGTGYRFELSSDKAVMDLFSMEGIPPTLNLFVEVETLIATVYPDVGDDSDVEVVKNEPNEEDGSAYHKDDIYEMSDEDREWGSAIDGDLQYENIVGMGDNNLFDDEFDEEVSDYQSGDDEGRYSSEGEGEIVSKGKGVAATSYGNEPYLDGEGEVVLERHMIFEDVNAFRAKLRDYIVEKGFKIVRDKNEKGRLTAHCAVVGCKWRIHASPMFDGTTYQIKTLPYEHTCIRHNQNDEATSTWISKKLFHSFKENPHLTLDAMQEKLHSKYGLEASHSQLYRAKRKCQDVLEGNHGEQYKLLQTYAMEVRKTNPGSLFKMQYDRPSLTVNPMFQRLFVCFEAMKAGFLNGCRPFLGIDGCHLKGPYGGVLIFAVALDGNNGLFPIAIGVVEVECKESWGFFLSNLQTIIESSNYIKPWTIMSDQQKGLEKLVTELIAEASHRKCCRHIFQNFKARFPGLVLRKQFWVAARAYTERHFNHAMNIIKDTNTEAHAYLIKLGVHTWARHCFDDRVRSDHITNNLAESFNNWIGHWRGKPILTMLEGIRCKVMT